MVRSKLTGLKKAAILLMALGPSLSAKILRHFSESDIERIRTPHHVETCMEEVQNYARNQAEICT